MKVIDILKRHFEKKQKEHSHYSLRLLAKRSGISAPYLSQIFSGKRNLQMKHLEEICDSLDLDRETKNSLYYQFIKENNVKGIQYQDSEKTVKERPSDKILPQNKKKFNVITPWYNLPVMDATLLSTFDGTREWIARKLGFDQKRVDESVSFLINAGILEEDEGRLRKVDAHIEFRTTQSPEKLREHHSEFLDVARNVLETKISSDDLDKRFISGMTLAVSEKKAQEIKARLNEFLYEILDIAEADKNTSEVYRVSLQFFPIE